jgi:carboxylesterase type B
MSFLSQMWLGTSSARFADWIYDMTVAGVIERIKNEEKPWYYNHKPKEKVGKQQWEAYSTIELYYIFDKLEKDEK